jgi:hypothetical protein
MALPQFPVSPGDNNGGFATNEGGAAFGNPTITRQGQTAGATQVQYESSAPPNALAAPTASPGREFVGLCDALNQHQQYLVKAGRRQYADIYEIKFVPASLAASWVKKPGPTDITVTAQQTPNSAAKLNPATQSVNNNSQAWQVQGGTQIVQLIDQIMRNSSYITEQQLWQYDPIPDPKTGIQKLKKNPKAGTGVTAWYKISVQSTQLKYDSIIKDDAYRMTFIINTYALADLHSDYFAPIPYRGVHKSYNYWFTGLNTQILNYEQQIDNMYRLTITGTGDITPAAQASLASSRDQYLQYRKTYMATSANRAQGAKGFTNEPGDNAAAFLYDLASIAKAKLEIVGDPAWLQQGEVGTGINWPKFNFNPFNADGGINFDSQQVLFDISFNQPTDYNFNTGLMNVNANNTSLNGPLGGLPQANFTYVANRCRSVFSKGTFKQHLEGRLKIEYEKKVNNNNARPVATTTNTTAASTTPTVSRTNTITRVESVGEIQYDQMGVATGYQETVAEKSPVTPQSAPPAKPPTSSGPLLDLTTPPTGLGGASLTTTPTLNPNATGQTFAPQPTTPQKTNREY